MLCLALLGLYLPHFDSLWNRYIYLFYRCDS